MDINNLIFYLGRDNFIYSGESNEPEITVKYGETILVQDTDYTLEYKDTINAGIGTVKVTGIGDYTGEKILEFIINPLSILTAHITCGEPDEITGCYNLSNLKISMGNIELVENVDYTKEVKEVVDGHFVTSVVTFKGIGNFSDTASKHFLTNYTGIIRKNISKLDITVGDTIFEYNGREKKVDITILDEDYTLIEDVDYSITYENNIDAGIGKAIINGIGEVYFGSKEYKITITPISINDGSLSCGAKDEEGFYNTDNVTLSVNYKILTLGKDFTYKVESVPEEEKYVYAIITVTGINNYTGTISGKFIIGRYYIDIKTANISLKKDTFGYTGKNILPEIIASNLEIDVDYTVEFPEESISIGTYIVLVKGTGKYNGILELRYVISSLTVADAEVTFGEPDGAGFYQISNMVVKIGDMILEQFIDYKYKVVEKEIENGFVESTCTIIGINNFSGTIEVSIITSRKEKYAGKIVQLEKVTIYPRYGSWKSDIIKSGTFYLWDENIKNRRIRITNNLDGIKKPGYITGWVNVEDLEPKEGLLVGDMVLVNGVLNTYADGKGNKIIKKNAIMYITDKLDPLQFEYNYGIATAMNRTRQGWVKEESIKKYEK